MGTSCRSSMRSSAGYRYNAGESGWHTPAQHRGTPPLPYYCCCCCGHISLFSGLFAGHVPVPAGRARQFKTNRSLVGSGVCDCLKRHALDRVALTRGDPQDAIRPAKSPAVIFGGTMATVREVPHLHLLGFFHSLQWLMYLHEKNTLQGISLARRS